jgi:flagellar basal-body rod modification protein FlgD
MTTPTTPTSTSTSAPTDAAGKALQNASSVLGKDDFLRLLVTQLKYQDPLKPTDQSQFMSQMAQFSTVEGITNLQSSLDAMNKSDSVSQAVGLIGKQVTYLGEDGTTQSGLASAVSFAGGGVTVHVGDTDVTLDQIATVAQPSEATGA